MNSTLAALPLTRTCQPSSLDEVAALLAEAYAGRTAVYPLGGETSLDYGLPAKVDGWGLSLAGMRRVVDYPARDMTVTVEAGVTMTELAELLAGEGQQLPIDVPHPDRATIGGVVATAFNGPRRHGLGSIRDHVIGIQAVDGRGMPFKGGGRVVKNVAGYDFCKLLTGSLGTLGVITQLTFKLRPLPQQWAVLSTVVDDWDQAERQLAALVQSPLAPSAIELLSGPAWHGHAALPAGTSGDDSIGLAVFLEGTTAEVDWMRDELQGRWRRDGLTRPVLLEGDAARRALRDVAEFPAGDAPLVLRGSVVPSYTTRMMARARELFPGVSLLAHAGSGTVLMRLAQFPAEGLSRTVVARLQSLAAAGHGHVSVLANPAAAEMTHQCVWGGIDVPFDLMTAVKRQFDPHNLLNPGRFVYL